MERLFKIYETVAIGIVIRFQSEKRMLQYMTLISNEIAFHHINEL